MNRLKRYLENHKDATIEDYNNQRHRMHVIQYERITRSKHSGSKSKKTLLSTIKQNNNYSVVGSENQLFNLAQILAFNI